MRHRGMRFIEQSECHADENVRECVRARAVLSRQETNVILVILVNCDQVGKHFGMINDNRRLDKEKIMINSSIP